MGLPSYQYPTVHPPAMQFQYQSQEQPLQTRQNPRYSWMDPPSEHPDGSYVPNAVSRGSDLSQLPMVPEHYQASHIQSNQQRSQVHTKEQDVSSTYRTTESRTQVNTQEDFYTKTQPTQERTAEAGPLPVKERYAHYHSDKKVHIGPDENPLTPGSPPPVMHFPGKFQNRSSSAAMDMNFSAPLKSSNHSEPISGGSWQHGLCSCAEPAICIPAIFCPCIVYGRTQYKLNLRSEKKDPSNMLGYSAVNGSCATWAVLCGVNILLSAIQHTRVRKAYDMDPEAGNVVTDCLKSVCCCCCMLAQDEKEVKYREELGRRGNQRASVGYIPPSRMTFNRPP